MYRIARPECRLWVLLLILWMLSACSTVPPTATPEPSPTLSPTRTSTPEPTPTPAYAEVRVDPGVRYQTMDGIGANCYAFPFSSDIGWKWDAVRYVFDELDLAYVRIAPWLGWWETANDNDDPYQINRDGFGTVIDIINRDDVPFSRFLHERGIEVALGVWDFGGVAEYCEDPSQCPDWLAGGQPRQIAPELYPEMGESISAYVLHMQENGVPVDTVQVQNEPDIEAGIRYPSPEALRDAGLVLLDQLDHFGLEKVQLYGPDLHSPQNIERWAEPWFENPRLRERTRAVSYHTWWSMDLGDFQRIWEFASRYDKPVWATELGYAQTLAELQTETWKTGWQYARSYYRAIAGSHASRTYQWTLLGNDSAVSQQGERYPTYYVLMHFANYIPAGAVLVESQSGEAQLLSLVFERPDGRYTAIVLNERSAERSLVLRPVSGTGYKVIERITTYQDHYAVAGDPTADNREDGVWITLPPQSITSMILDQR